MTPILERMMDKFTVNDGCWEWTGATNGRGYGTIRKGRAVDGMVYAHRVMYEELIGPIPDDLEIDHLCRNRSCVNPEHLEPVTAQENVLRGDTIAAHNVAKTHCPSGHPYSGDNLYVYPSGDRRCMACHRVSNRKWKANAKRK